MTNMEVYWKHLISGEQLTVKVDLLEWMTYWIMIGGRDE